MNNGKIEAADIEYHINGGCTPDDSELVCDLQKHLGSQFFDSRFNVHWVSVSTGLSTGFSEYRLRSVVSTDPRPLVMECKL
jgi:hypothetical protein